MKKAYIVENLDCAHCAAKFESAVKNIENVNAVTVSFLAQKMIIEAEAEHIDSIIKAAKYELSKIEPDAEIIV